MRKENPVRYSSAVGESWQHCEFKIKYCHSIFDDEIYREGLRTLLLEAAYSAEIPVGEIGFDNNHVYFMADICNYRRLQKFLGVMQERNSLSISQKQKANISGAAVCVIQAII